MATQDSRIKLKRSTIAATVPTVPSSNDHTDGTWIATDIYKGELFYNQADGVLWTRGDSGIECIQGTAKLTIASADVLTLNATPVSFGLTVASGTAIHIISATGSMTYNSTPYATNGNMIIRCVGANSGQVGFDDNGLLFGTVSRTVPAAYVLSDGTTDTFLIDGADLEVTVDVGNPTAGDSDITVYVTYRIIIL